jgi:hypothetical protein
LTTYNERADRIRQVRHSITHRPADANISLWPSHDRTTVRPFNGCATARSFYISTLTPASATITAPLPRKCLRIPQKTGRNHDSHYEKNSKNEKTFFQFHTHFPIFDINSKPTNL